MNTLHKTRYKKAFNAHLGFFGDIYDLNKHLVLKKYRGTSTIDAAKKIQTTHLKFIEQLTSIGIAIPKTVLHIVPLKKKFAVEITQERFERNELAGEIIKKSKKETVLYVVKGIINDAIVFITSPQSTSIGFHPTVRNYAVRNNTFYMIDTFPPYTSKLHTMIVMRRYAPSRKMKIIMTIFFPFLLGYIHEYYSPVSMIYGIYGTASRLRPEFTDDFREFILQATKTFNWHNALKKKLLRPSKQTFKWKFVQTLLKHPQTLNK